MHHAAPDRYLERLQEFIATGNPGGAAELFMVEAVGQPQEMVDGFKGTPLWTALEAMAPTLVYDALQMGDSSLPTDLLRKISTETLAIHSTGSPAWMQSAVATTAAALPNAHLVALDGQFHQVSQDVLVEAFKDFFGSGR